MYCSVYCFPLCLFDLCTSQTTYSLHRVKEQTLCVPEPIHYNIYLQKVHALTLNPKLMQLTAVYLKVPEGYIGFVEELPGANTQGNTLEETRANLQEAVKLVLEANQEFV